MPPSSDRDAAGPDDLLRPSRLRPNFLAPFSGSPVGSRTVAGSIRVDIDGLAELAKALRGIQQELDNLGHDFGRYEAAIGAPRVKAKLSEVAGNWSTARQRIGQDLGQLASMADVAAATYRATEDTISQAAGGSGPGGP